MHLLHILKLNLIHFSSVCLIWLFFPLFFVSSSFFSLVSVKSASTMYSVNGPQSIHMQHYYKYINSNASHFSPLQYPKQSQPSQPMPSVPNSPSVCSSGRYLDTYGTHKSSFASTENANTTLSAVSTVSPTGHVKRKRSWSRAVFSQLQRKGLEIQFQIQKYITKPDRRKLAARLGLTDAQVHKINLYILSCRVRRPMNRLKSKLEYRFSFIFSLFLSFFLLVVHSSFRSKYGSKIDA